MERILTIETIKCLHQEVKLCGWVNSRRDHGKLIFIDLRDKSGLVQVVFTPQKNSVYQQAKRLRGEWVIEVIGKVNKRPKENENPHLPTGKIEIEATFLKIYSKAKTLPFSIETDGYEISEEKRLKYRYLDLRRKRLQRNLRIRQKVIRFMRNFLEKEGFLEIETPILTKSTPEGARDFLVPSRLQRGKFYALPQSPQQYKQLLMVGGIEKYFQIARCLRDEDPRADRQAEHTQLDLELSFSSQEEILGLVERLYKELIEALFPEKKIQKFPFPRLKYNEVMKKYHSDKPDLRQNKSNPNELAFCFVTDFPMFEWHEKEKKWGAMHHPFTSPQIKDIEEIKKTPEKILAFQYDIVLNGYEIGGGSIRTTDTRILLAVFQILNHQPKEVKKQFGHLLESFQYGVPPHGGIALGIERFLSIILNEKSIREVIAFPKTGDNRDLMMDTPSEVSKSQLDELHIEIIKKENE